MILTTTSLLSVSIYCFTPDSYCNILPDSAIELLLCVFTVPPTPVLIQVNPSRYGSLNTGSRLTLTCIAVKATTGLTLPAETSWFGPNGTKLMTSDSIIVADAVMEPLRTVHTITFTSLSTSHAGVYSCGASLSSPALTIPYQTMTSHTVLISRKFTH